MDTLTLTWEREDAKNAMVVFSCSEHLLRGILDLIHSEVCGPMSSYLLTGNLFMLLSLVIVPECIYFLKNKDEFFSRFQEFKALVEN